MDTPRQTNFDFSGGAEEAPLLGTLERKRNMGEARSLGDVMEDTGNILLFAKTAPRSFWDGMKLDD